jgi:hypothetical protein
MGDGFLPDFQAEIKSEFKPTTMEMYCQINRTTFLIAALLAIVFLRVQAIIDFLLYY